MRPLPLSIIVGLALTLAACGPEAVPEPDLYALARTDRLAFVDTLTQEASTDVERAQAVVTWLAQNLDWTATDYKKRSVQQIIDRKGGNCAELAQVTTAMLDELNLTMRKVREINLHVENDSRQSRAEDKVRERGKSMSVFGRRHNDHVWIEVHDSVTDRWFPADPSLGVIGEKEWLQARLGFGERFSLDPTSQDMIAPFAVFAVDGNWKLEEDRTAHYLIEGFNSIHDGRLAELPQWPHWVESVEFLSARAHEAFMGETDLHQHEERIADLIRTYNAMRDAYLGR